MNTFQTILAILPGILICAWIIYNDRHEPEPVVLLVLGIFLGMISSVPAIYLERLGMDILNISSDSSDVSEMLLQTIVVVGGVEESIKYLVLFLIFYPRKAFNEPLDGIVYSVMISMGFAMIENVIYSDRYGIEVVLLRAFTAVPAHGAFAILMGYHVGLAKFARGGNKFYHLIFGLLGAIFIHGIYDFFLLQTWIPELSMLGVVVLSICIVYTHKLLQIHAALSEENN